MITIREAKKIYSLLKKRFDFQPINLRFKNVRRGFAYYNSRNITYPLWIFETVNEYTLYYIVHEIVHFITKDKFGMGGHGELFKNLEKQILEGYNILPIYAKAYPKELRTLDGKYICGRLGKKED